MAGINRGSGKSDRITKLPDEIIGHILGYLPICDAVRTCVLSGRWRYSWTKTVRLNLYYDESMEKKMSSERFFKLVLRVLASHIGPIHKCVFRPKPYENQEVSDVKRDVNTWVRLLSTMDVNDLTFDCHSDLNGRFKLPPYAFQCLGLSCLTLQDCKLKYSIAFKGFPNLTRLDLSYVELHEDMLDKVILNCPLEMLFLKHCDFHHSNIDFRPCLNAISASNLRVLDIVGHDGLYFSYLKYTFNLKVASLLFESRYSDDDDADRMYYDWIASGFDVLIYMPKIEVLTYCCRLRMTHASSIIPKELPELLGNLKTVSLRDMDGFSANEKSFMFCIMRRCPNLENLEIHITNIYMSRTDVDKDSMRAVIAYLEVEAEEEIRTSITTLTVSYEWFDEWEHIEAHIALIESIVSCCPALGKLVVKGSSSVKGHAKLQLSRAIRRFGRTSSKPKIIYSNAH